VNIQEKQTTQVKITNVENLDPIWVWIDETQEKRNDNSVIYSAHLVILCYGVALNHYWSSMGMPLKEFFIKAHTEYIANKFRINARETYRPAAFDAVLNEETDEVTEVENPDVRLEMADFHYAHICKIIDAVKECFKEQLKAINHKEREV